MDSILSPTITLPIPGSRATTPNRPFCEGDEIDPDTPTNSRQRSDTMMTTSSSSSFPQLQTPETPSILGNAYQTTGSPIDLGPVYRRKDIYILGAPVQTPFQFHLNDEITIVNSSRVQNDDIEAAHMDNYHETVVEAHLAGESITAHNLDHRIGAYQSVSENNQCFYVLSYRILQI